MGCYNKIPQIRWLINEKLISHSSGDWKFKIRMAAWSDDPLLGLRPLIISSHDRRGKEALLGLFYKDISSIHEGRTLTHLLKTLITHPLKALLLIILDIRIFT